MNSFAPQARQGPSRRLSLLSALAAIFVTACGQPAAVSPAPAAAPSVQEAPDPKAEISSDSEVVVFLGDSLTAGYGLQPDEAMPDQVEAIWRASGLDAVAVNAGVSGDTTANGLARFDWSVAAAEPDLLVVALGANDFLMGVPPDIARANLAAILERARAAGIPAVLVGLTPRGALEPGSREAAYAAIYPELAAEYGVPYYPSLLGQIEGDPSLLQPDGLHPTKEGVVVISAPLAAFLEPVILSIEAQ
ncbi:MAG: arylesterase [Hyphomonas sp.]|nr:arylesterase [Hyphomonas sp.]